MLYEITVELPTGKDVQKYRPYFKTDNMPCQESEAILLADAFRKMWPQARITIITTSIIETYEYEKPTSIVG